MSEPVIDVDWWQVYVRLESFAYWLGLNGKDFADDAMAIIENAYMDGELFA